MRKADWGIIAVAIVWAAVIIASSSKLDGTPFQASILQIQGGGAAATIIILGGTRRTGNAVDRR